MSGRWWRYGLVGLAGLLLAWPRPTHAHAAVRVMGATSLVPFLRAVAPLYMRETPGTTVHVSGGGSLAGLAGVLAGRVDLGASDIPPEAAGIPRDVLRGVALGRLPVVPIINPAAGVRALTGAELRAVLAGRVRNWQELGGRDAKVVVVVRPPGSGARWVMARDVMRGWGFASDAVVQLSNGAVWRTVADTPGAIGFVDAGFARPGTVVPAVDGRHFDPAHPGRWPYAAPAVLYARPGAPASVWRFARWAAGRPERATFGIATEEGATGGVGASAQSADRGAAAAPLPGRGRRAGVPAGRPVGLVRPRHRGRPEPVRHPSCAAGNTLGPARRVGGTAAL
ncbi:MAG: substrate-binding domain-containing protein [Actinomycetia bacterium]|nr:substrate-binding domain-containing protein [Actinomycetes bacterium]